jgi:hypothetical protein
MDALQQPFSPIPPSLYSNTQNVAQVANNNNNVNAYPPQNNPQLAASSTGVVNNASTNNGPAKKRASFTACSACQSKHCACDELRYVNCVAVTCR